MGDPYRTPGERPAAPRGPRWGATWWARLVVRSSRWLDPDGSRLSRQERSLRRSFRRVDEHLERLKEDRDRLLKELAETRARMARIAIAASPRHGVAEPGDEVD